MIFGVDRGTTFTKTDNLRKFKSTVRRVSKDDVLIDKDSIFVEYNGTDYIVGESGEYETDLFKSENEYTLLLILTALAQCTSDYDIRTNLVTGLPIGQYSGQKVQFKNLLNNTSHSIKVNGQRRNIYINKADIFPEAAGAFMSSNYQSGLVIDVGGISVDCALFEDRKLKHSSTYPMGIMKLYAKIANSLNAKFGTSLVEWDVERTLVKGIYKYGEKQDIDRIVKDIEQDHTQGIINRLNLEYDTVNIKNMILAGGAINIHSHIKNQFKHATTIENSQFANAIGFRNVGRSLYNNA